MPSEIKSLSALISTSKEAHLPSYQLEEASPESDTVHGIKQEIDAEVCIEEQHAELLDTPQVRRCCRFPQRVEKEYVEAHRVAENNLCSLYIEAKFFFHFFITQKCKGFIEHFDMFTVRLL